MKSDGSGYGSVSGHGPRYGDGSGYGSVSGHGPRYGDGDGYGDGSGYGYGSGYGDGDGYGDGQPDYWQAAHELALAGDLARVPPGVAAHPEVCRDFAIENGLRTLATVMPK